MFVMYRDPRLDGAVSVRKAKTLACESSSSRAPNLPYVAVSVLRLFPAAFSLFPITCFDR